MKKIPRVYMRANRKSGIIYIGVTAYLNQRSYQHDIEMDSSSFVSRYKLTRLVYIETFERIVDAIEREKKLKDLPRARKVKLIEQDNPEWEDLTPLLVDDE